MAVTMMEAMTIVGMSYRPLRGNQPSCPQVSAQATPVMNVQASATRFQTIRALTNTDTSAAISRLNRTIASRRRREGAIWRRSTVSGTGWATVASVTA